MEQVEVKALVDSTLTLCQARYKEHNTKLKIADLPDGLQLYCHSSQISQVLLNLLNNALDAVQVNPEEERLVELDYSEDKDSITFSITDNGPGVPSSLRQKIMQAFFTTKAPGKGTGLGLSISLAIIQKHHGRLWLDESSPQTRFLVRLPKSQPQLASA
jgi:C4-dicarboxylate-specific signal transduction histidine kinase